MASNKKQSEGIALLSMYKDEDDDEMDDVEEEGEYADAGTRGGQHHQDAGAGDEADEDFSADTGRMAVINSGNAATNIPTPQRLVSPQEQRRLVSSVTTIRMREKLTIVDYGHDEVAMSPEPEEGEIGDQLHVTNGDFMDRTPSGTVQLLTPSYQTNNPQFSEPLKSDAMDSDAMIRSDDAEIGEEDQDEQRSLNPFDNFLPPPPTAKCTEELQTKINKFLDLKKAGRSFNGEVRNRKNYRNPDFLLHAVSYQDIDQIGSCFSKDVFDPHGCDPSDFYDEIEADMRRGSDRKEQGTKKAQKAEFICGGTQPGIVAGALRISMPVAGGSAVTASGLHLVAPTTDSINRDGRQNKKSKWDKVDGDGKNPLPSVGQDSVSTVGANAATLSAANAGGGYTQFAQQKRREAEEQRSSERRLERRFDCLAWFLKETECYNTM
ncbi:PREDICTED: SAP30-binding protein-like isoform X1 [Lupinus angustifolius]|uniref:SAP30-binding protein-like isoform X1 n=1 Tax=Lupinus angustifolius TaxID=3871 RepID=UPI00092EB855|nr:PREDICTED: SAP30-binding protein-like isoform X1 [Lupinus angustifolius]